jgi:hypothetical protein
MCLQGEADANKVSEQVTLGYTQATTATTGGQLSARSGLSLPAEIDPKLPRVFWHHTLRNSPTLTETVVYWGNVEPSSCSLPGGIIAVGS